MVPIFQKTKSEDISIIVEQLECLHLPHGKPKTTLTRDMVNNVILIKHGQPSFHKPVLWGWIRP